MVDSGLRVGEPRPRRSTGAKSKPLQRQRNPALTKQDILVSARTEFCEFGLDGAASTGSLGAPLPTSAFSTTTSATRKRSTPQCCLVRIARFAKGNANCTSRRSRRRKQCGGWSASHLTISAGIPGSSAFSRRRTSSARVRKENHRHQGAAFADRRADPHRSRRRPEGEALPPRRRPDTPLYLDRWRQLFLFLQHPHALGDLRRSTRIRERNGGAAQPRGGRDNGLLASLTRKSLSSSALRDRRTVVSK